MVGLPRGLAVNIGLLDQLIVIFFEAEVLNADSRLLSIGLPVFSNVLRGALAFTSDRVKAFSSCRS
jgi:hypothetical protein